jgi:hypothetical protein
MRHVSTIGTILATVMIAAAVFAQTAPKVFVAPNKGQSKEQQNKDTAECRQWATEQAPPSQAATGAGTHGRGTVGGAAKGAAVGAAVGAIVVRLPFADLAGRDWRLQDQLEGLVYDRDGRDLQTRGLYLDVLPWQASAFTLTRRS